MTERNTQGYQVTKQIAGHIVVVYECLTIQELRSWLEKNPPEVPYSIVKFNKLGYLK